MNSPRTDAIKCDTSERQDRPVRLTLSEYAVLRIAYDEERKHEGHNFAKEHSFEEWVNNRLTID